MKILPFHGKKFIRKEEDLYSKNLVMQLAISFEVMCAYLKSKLAGRSAPCQHSFTSSMLVYLRNSLHESSKMFVEHALHVGRM